jgi:hypothetical protein
VITSLTVDGCYWSTALIRPLPSVRHFRSTSIAQ